ncbi:MAG: phosphotransferase system lactose/cellobiose-specific subunit [Firmicutes bacterium]|nr:phosphotransferase system lactose/cellobiose-specific subunit [Bacillota bacterium]
MKILLVCAAGMSTSLVAESMQDALSEEEKDWVISAEPSEQFHDVVNEYDVVLLGPQVRFKKDEFQEAAGENIPVAIINTIDYGCCRGDKILQAAKELYKNKLLGERT